MEEQKSLLKDQIKRTPDAHCRKKAALQEKKKEVSKRLRDAKGKHMAIAIVDNLETSEQARKIASKLADDAKEIAPKSTVTTISGEKKDIGAMFGDTTHEKSKLRDNTYAN